MPLLQRTQHPADTQPWFFHTGPPVPKRCIGGSGASTRGPGNYAHDGSEPAAVFGSAGHSHSQNLLDAGLLRFPSISFPGFLPTPACQRDEYCHPIRHNEGFASTAPRPHRSGTSFRLGTQKG